MAISDTTNLSPAAAPAGAGPQAAATQAAPQQSSTNTWSFHSSGLFGAPINRDLSSEYMTKLVTGLTEIYKSADADSEITLLQLDPSNEPALVYSSLVVCLNIKNKKDRVAYHVLICEATSDPLAPIQENIANQQIEVLRVTSDALDAVLAEKVKQRVANAFPRAVSYMVDACVVPRSFNPDDKKAMQQLALNAGLATKTELIMRTPSWYDFNLATNQRDSMLVINQQFTTQQIEDVVGNPMRSDVLVQFSSQKQRDPQAQQAGLVNTGDREAKISEVSGFVDLVWSPVNPMPVNNYYNVGMPVVTQKYAARLVLTNLASNFAYTPASLLLALASALTLGDDNNWFQAFRPAQTGKDIDLHDVGALNIEANLSNEPGPFGTRIDTKVDTFRLEDMGKLLAALVQPGLMISLDCPEYGPQSWYTSMFAAGAAGANSACDAIYEAAMDLTNGEFGKYFQKGAKIFVDTGNRVHLGYWYDAKGVKRDIRDIDTVAVANLIGDRDPQVIREWSDTFLRTDYPLAQRLAARKKFISGLTNQNAVFTGFAQRVTFTASFLDALSKSIRELKIPVRVNTPLTSSAFNNARGVAGFVNEALRAPGMSFMHAQAGGNANPYTYGMSNQFRW